MCSAMADLTQFYGETFHIDWGEKLKKEAVPWKIDFLETCQREPDFLETLPARESQSR